MAGNPTSPASLNRHAYTANNPISRVDPSGRFFEELFDAALSFGVGVEIVLNGGNTDAVAAQVQREAKDSPTVAKAVGRIADKGQARILKDAVSTSAEMVIRSTPGVGTLVGLHEAIGGHDYFTGQQLSEGERLENLGFALLAVANQLNRPQPDDTIVAAGRE